MTSKTPPCTSAKSVLEFAHDKNVQFFDFRFTDARGGWHHITFHSSAVDKDVLEKGVMFDGSSIAGWKHIENSDMLLQPDFESSTLDPFAAQTTLILSCDVLEPAGDSYARDPRGVAKRAEDYLKKTGFADTAYFGPEAEFFLFDDVRFDVQPQHSFFYTNSSEGPYNSGQEDELGNLGHRPAPKGGYIPVSPIDHMTDIRSEMLTVLERMGLATEKHHHEVAPAQHELGFIYSTLLKTADNLQKYKYVVKNVAKNYGLTATFMPKPIDQDNGSGMHVHQSLWKGKDPVFPGKVYADLSQEALWYIGGILKHGKALNAFTNPATNSYKRLVPGYEAPVILTYSARNRSACIRIPHTPFPKAKRIEARFPDPASNPYFCFSAMLMAGLDGIKNKIDPGEPGEGNLYDPHVSRGIPQVARNLREALEALDKDREFLKEGGVFSDDLIDGYISLKMEEVEALETKPQPIEYKLYYSV